ncbi:MAG: lipoprotein [Rhodocyclales bacterium]|nr:lipoprotein [Rhodocyclales bacterium]
MRFLLPLVLALALAGCGVKGPLYLPSPPSSGGAK